jgi:hypothetical protein
MSASFCPTCGVDVPLELGCCTACGMAATGPAVDILVGLLTPDQRKALRVQVVASPATAVEDPEANLSVEALEFLDDIDDAIASAEDLPERAEDFADGVLEKLRSIRQWVVDNDHVTEAQERAVQNMAGGIARWER